MSDDLGFLRDIIAHPDDPVPRLVYADWLDERDDPRGEFLDSPFLLWRLHAQPISVASCGPSSSTR
jgi:uncharacterized protein (TIGR02996 family)